MLTIDKVTFYLMGMQKGWYLDSFWVKSCLSVFKTEDKTHYIARTDNEGFYFLDEETGEKIRITGTTDTTKPLFRLGEMLDIPAGFMPNHKEKIRTSAGCLLQNYLLVIGPFNGKIPYFNKRFNPSDVEKMIIPLWKNEEEITDENRDTAITTKEYLVYANNGGHLSNYTQTCVASISEKSLRTNPLLEKRRKELYEEYGDKLSDPVIAAKVDEELTKIDKEWMKDDESMGFLIKGKAFTNTRKRLNNHFGTPTGLTDKQPDFISRPLREGMDLSNLPSYVNDAYSGSIGRGLETQEGGVQVKNATRAAANLKVSGDDCGTKYGQMIKIPSSREKATKYLKYWFVEGNKSIQITESNIDSLLGKILQMRSPATCINKDNSYCRKCVGPYIAEYPNGLVMVNTQPGSRVMNLSMKAMHSSTVSVTKWKSDLIS